MSKRWCLLFLLFSIFFGHSQVKSQVQQKAFCLWSDYLLSSSEVSDAVQYFTMTLTGNLSAQGFYLINRLSVTALRQERRKATTRLGWDGSRGGDERLLQHGSRRNGKKINLNTNRKKSMTKVKLFHFFKNTLLSFAYWALSRCQWRLLASEVAKPVHYLNYSESKQQQQHYQQNYPSYFRLFSERMSWTDGESTDFCMPWLLSLLLIL